MMRIVDGSYATRDSEKGEAEEFKTEVYDEKGRVIAKAITIACRSY